MGLLLENFDLSVFHADTLEELVEIDVAHELHLFCNIFQLGESFYFGLLELLQLVLFQLFELNFVFEPLEHPIKCGDFRLCSL